MPMNNTVSPWPVGEKSICEDYYEKGFAVVTVWYNPLVQLLVLEPNSSFHDSKDRNLLEHGGGGAHL